ncbi:unnamed protein product, partial [Porites evermanni]
MVMAILQAPVFFFDSNPVGRILNRWIESIARSPDISATFSVLVSMQGFFPCLSSMICSLVIEGVAPEWFCIEIGMQQNFACPRFFLVLFMSHRRYSNYRPQHSARYNRIICQTVENTSFLERLLRILHAFAKGYQVYKSNFGFLVPFDREIRLISDQKSAFGFSKRNTPLFLFKVSLVGLSLVYVVQSMNMTQYAVRQLTEIETLMTSVERVITYTELESEPGCEVERDPPEIWPHEGNIAFKDVHLTYYPGGPQSLKNITLNINGGAKIGIVGRTGAGKSSFVAALMRMPEAGGDILIDNINISSINLQESRRAITILGQNPALFIGSLRQNLDLMEQFEDAELWRALEKVQLKSLVENLEGQLDHKLLEHGANLSVGERQLICLARVLLQQKNIVILDEPTAHVDPDTEQTIWNIVREELKSSTVITIAHRLNTIRDCDKVLVLISGEVAGFDTFDVLINRKGGILSEMDHVTKAATYNL